MKKETRNHNRQYGNTKDFTQGNIYRELIRLSIPLIIGNILQQFYNTIDAFVVGRYGGAEEFAAIGIAGTVMNLYLFIITGACTGLSVLFARYYGLKDYEALRKQHFTALSAGLILSLILCTTGFACTDLLLNLIQTPQELTAYTAIYLRWIFLSLPTSFLYNMYASALRASGDTVAALCILTAAVTSNLALDYLMVAHMGQGICGAAKATALTQCISAVLCILYLAHAHREFLFRSKDCRLQRAMLQTTLKCSFVTALHQASLYIGKMFVQGAINTAGTDVISAYTAATRIEGFANSFGDSSSAATSVIVSQNYGASHPQRVQKTFRCSIHITAVLGILNTVILFITAGLTIHLMLGTAVGNAYECGVSYLRIVALFYLLCFMGNSFTGYYNGTGRVIFTLIGSAGQIFLRVVLSYAFCPEMQLDAVALATGIGWTVANLFWAAVKRNSTVQS